MLIIAPLLFAFRLTVLLAFRFIVLLAFRFIALLAFRLLMGLLDCFRVGYALLGNLLIVVVFVNIIDLFVAIHIGLSYYLLLPYLLGHAVFQFVEGFTDDGLSVSNDLLALNIVLVIESLFNVFFLLFMTLL